MNTKETVRDDLEINLLELLGVILRRAWLIILCMAILAAGTLAGTKMFVTPLYQSSVLFYVNNGQSQESKISNADIIAAQSLVETYLVVLKYGTTLDEVIEKTKLDCTREELAKKISSSSVNDTEIFQITVTDPDPEQAVKIAKTISKVLPGKVADVIDGSSVRIVREASVPTDPSSPNLKKNAVLGAIAGFLISVVYVVLRYLLDDKIRDASRYLKDTYPYPILTAIPDLTSRSTGYYYRAQNEGGKRR